jgi:hypothetical protein
MSSVVGGSDLFTLAGSVPAHSNSPGTPYQIAWDGSGNLYICYQTNTWARYTTPLFMVLPDFDTVRRR